MDLSCFEVEYLFRMQNLSSKVPEILWPDIKARTYLFKGFFKLRAGVQVEPRVHTKVRGQIPIARKGLQRRHRGLLNHLKLPPRHR